MKETITVFFEQHWPSVANAPYAAVAAIAVAAVTIVFFFGCFTGWLFAKRKDRMTEKIAAFFKRHWPRAVNMPLAVLGTVLAALAVAFLSLWLAKSTGVIYAFLRLVDFVLSPTVVATGVVTGAFVWFVNKFSEEISGLASRVKEIANIKFRKQLTVSESATTDAPPQPQAKADEETTGKIPASDSVAADKNESWVQLETAKTASATTDAPAKAKADEGSAEKIPTSDLVVADKSESGAKFATATASDFLAEIKRNAEAEDAAAQFIFGQALRLGRGVKQDDAEAAKWYGRAAKQGLATAQYNLGLMYHMGKGVSRDDAEAVKWFRCAAEQGHANAQGNLGAMYHNGTGVAQNYREAYIWHSIAAANGAESSVKYRDDDAKLLSAEDLASAQAEAARRMEEIRKQAESGK